MPDTVSWKIKEYTCPVLYVTRILSILKYGIPKSTFCFQHFEDNSHFEADPSQNCTYLFIFIQVTDFSKTFILKLNINQSNVTE